jgi:hypothetical protein
MLRIEIKWGVLFSLAGLLWMGGERLLGLHDQWIAWQAGLTNLFFFPAVTMIYLAIRERRRSLGGQIQFFPAFVSGTIVSLVVALLSPLTQFIGHRWISPHYFERAIAQAVSSGKLTLEQADRYFNLSSYMLQASLGAIVAGLLTSLVLGFLMRTPSLPAGVAPTNVETTTE